MPSWRRSALTGTPVRRDSCPIVIGRPLPDTDVAGVARFTGRSSARVHATALSYVERIWVGGADGGHGGRVGEPLRVAVAVGWGLVGVGGGLQREQLRVG